MDRYALEFSLLNPDPLRFKTSLPWNPKHPLWEFFQSFSSKNGGSVLWNCLPWNSTPYRNDTLLKKLSLELRSPYPTL